MEFGRECLSYDRHVRDIEKPRIIFLYQKNHKYLKKGCYLCNKNEKGAGLKV